MKKSRKLNTTALEIITDINKVLRHGNIKDTSNELFRFGCDYLLEHNMYHGYNFFKWYVTGLNTLNGMFENVCDDRYLSAAGVDCVRCDAGGLPVLRHQSGHPHRPAAIHRGHALHPPGADCQSGRGAGRWYGPGPHRLRR